METAGNENFDADTEKKGLGTPATRAEILEKLVKRGYVKRKGKSLIPTSDGITLVAVMPENLTSPLLTAEWENTLMRIERGEVQGKDFLSDITNMVKNLVASAPAPTAEDRQRFSSATADSIGVCPWCGADIREGKSNYYCSNRECSFCLWKESKFLSNMKKKLTLPMAKELLSDGRTFVNGLYSQKSGKTFDAYLVLSEATDRNGKRMASYTLEFPKGKRNAPKDAK